MEWLSPPSLTPASRQTCPACSGQEHSCCIAEDYRYTTTGPLVGEEGGGVHHHHGSISQGPLVGEEGGGIQVYVC